MESLHVSFFQGQKNFYLEANLFFPSQFPSNNAQNPPREEVLLRKFTESWGLDVNWTKGILGPCRTWTSPSWGKGRIWKCRILFAVYLSLLFWLSENLQQTSLRRVTWREGEYFFRRVSWKYRENTLLSGVALPWGGETNLGSMRTQKPLSWKNYRWRLCEVGGHG